MAVEQAPGAGSAAFLHRCALTVAACEQRGGQAPAPLAALAERGALAAEQGQGTRGGGGGRGPGPARQTSGDPIAGIGTAKWRPRRPAAAGPGSRPRPQTPPARRPRRARGPGVNGDGALLRVGRGCAGGDGAAAGQWRLPREGPRGDRKSVV